MADTTGSVWGLDRGRGLCLGHILDRVRQGGQVAPDSPAVTFGGVTRSYGDLSDRSLRLGDWLQRAGMRRGDRIAVLMRNSLAWFDVVFACGSYGFAWVPVNFMLKEEEIAFILNDSGARVLVFDEEAASLVEGLRARAVSVELYLQVGGSPTAGAVAFEDCFRLSGAEPEQDIGGGDLLLIQYTSGTTGHPKGAVHTHETVMWNSYHQIVDFALRATEPWLCVPSLCWVAGLHDATLATLWLGGHVFLRPSGGTAEAIVRDIGESGAGATLLVPTLVRRVVELVEREQVTLPMLQRVVTGGEPIDGATMDRFQKALPQAALIQTYGMSEFPSWMTIMPGSRVADKRDSVGLCNSISALKILGEDGQELAPLERGEIVVRSPATMVGYWRQQAETDQTLSDGWLHTGDLGFRDEEGFVYISGRKKDMYISGGINVYPAEVEDVIARHPGVAEVAVVGVPDQEWGETGAAVIVGRGASPTAEEIRSLCRAHLANYKVPRHVYFRSEPLPRTTSGKVLKRVLRDEISAVGR